MKAIAISKLEPGQRYLIDEQPLIFAGTRMTGAVKLDAMPVKFGYALFGDRWVFADGKGNEIEFKKGYNSAQKPGLVPAQGELVVEKTAKIVVY